MPISRDAQASDLGFCDYRIVISRLAHHSPRRLAVLAAAAVLTAACSTPQPAYMAQECTPSESGSSGSGHPSGGTG